MRIYFLCVLLFSMNSLYSIEEISSKQKSKGTFEKVVDIDDVAIRLKAALERHDSNAASRLLPFLPLQAVLTEDGKPLSVLEYLLNHLRDYKVRLEDGHELDVYEWITLLGCSSFLSIPLTIAFKDGLDMVLTNPIYLMVTLPALVYALASVGSIPHDRQFTPEEFAVLCKLTAKWLKKGVKAQMPIQQALNTLEILCSAA